MINGQQFCYPNFTSYTVSNPNPDLSYSVVVHQPIIHPQRVKPNTSTNQVQFSCVRLHTRPELDLDPGAASTSEMMTQRTDLTTYEQAGRIVCEATTVLTTFRSSGNFGLLTRYVVKHVMTTKQSNNIQPIKCDVCNIACSSECVLMVHKEGKKHLKNEQKLAISAIDPQTPPICSVVCSAQGVFNTHLMVKKHAAKAGGSVCEATNPSTTFPSSGKAGVLTQDVVNNVMEATKQRENIQPILCDVCNIPCSSEAVLMVHKQGKKHLKNQQKLAILAAIGPQMPPLVASATVEGEMETKKSKLLRNGASVDTLIFCDVCNVVCNNQGVFNAHLKGKKHAAQVTVRGSNGNGVSNTTSAGTPQVRPLNTATQEQTKGKTNAVQSAWCEVCKISCNSYDVLSTHMAGKKHLKNLKKSEQMSGTPSVPISPPSIMPIGPVENPKPNEGKVINSKEMKSVWCEICGIGCDTHDVLKIHISGKKHQKNVEKSQKPIGPNPAPTSEPAPVPRIIGPMQIPVVHLERCEKKARRSMASQDDLEAKRQKILKEGAVAGSLRTCTICNVVCNSPTVFISHLASQKHAAMAVKQAEAGRT